MRKHNEQLNRQEWSWILYDWANSAYATIVMAAVFPIFFSSMAGSAGQHGDSWWGFGTSVAMLVVAVCAPVIGALADFEGYKKRLFAVFLAVGLVFTLLSACTEDWRLLLVGYIVSHIGFSAGNLVYDSFLPDITTPERMDKVSSYGFAFGYIGGSTIPFLASIALITFGERFGIGNAAAIRISVVITAVWWGVFSIPFLRHVHQRHGVKRPDSGILRETFGAVARTARHIYRNKGIFVFVLAYFFYIDGVGTVINMATSYGATLGLSSTGMVLALLVTQLVAVPFSLLFSALSGRFGALRLLTGAVCVYLGICLLGYVMGFGLEEGFLDTTQALRLFWLLAVLVGTVQGGIQAISRSYFGRLVPPENAGEFFGFFDIFGKFASVLGPGLYALTKALTGRSSLSILSIILLFLAALLVLGCGRRHLIQS